MWLITVLLESMNFSPHTASNSSSLETTWPRCSHRYHRMENSSGVSASSSPNRVHLWLAFEMVSPRKSYSCGALGAGVALVVADVAPQLRLDPRHQLQRVERLGDVVVGTQGQAHDLVHVLHLGGQHDDGDRCCSRIFWHSAKPSMSAASRPKSPDPADSGPRSPARHGHCSIYVPDTPRFFRQISTRSARRPRRLRSEFVP